MTKLQEEWVKLRDSMPKSEPVTKGQVPWWLGEDEPEVFNDLGLADLQDEDDAEW